MKLYERITKVVDEAPPMQELFDYFVLVLKIEDPQDFKRDLQHGIIRAVSAQMMKKEQK